ncbi:MAG: hypothetical protein ABH825_02700, partial [Candidatus Omnitrophota bacterium]
LGPGEQKDWLPYNFFEFDAFNPNAEILPLLIKIKDVHGFQYQEVFNLEGYKKQTFSLELDAIDSIIDLRNMSYLRVFLYHPKERVTFFLDSIRLRGKKPKGVRFSQMPFLEFSDAEYPEKAGRGDRISLTFYFMTKQRLDNDYKVFLHLMPISESKKGLRSLRGQINADFYPEIPTTKWREGVVYMVGPVEVTIPKDNPSGTYLIRAGLFNEGQKKVKSPQFKYSFMGPNAGGPFDFFDAYPKLRYTNSKYRDYLIGKFTVE